MFNELVMQYDKPFMNQNVEESSDKNILISFSLLMRLMEWCHEDAKDDVEMHKVMEKMVELNNGEQPLTIADYETILSALGNGEEQPSEEAEEEGCGECDGEMVEPMQTGCFSEIDMSNTTAGHPHEYPWEIGLDDSLTTVNLNGDEDCCEQPSEGITPEMEKEIQELIKLGQL